MRFRTVRFAGAFARPVRYAALLAGALPIAAFPGLDLEFGAWFGLVPGLLLMRAAPTRREAAVRGWWFGTGYLLAALYWLIPNLGPAWLLVAIAVGSPFAGLGWAARELLRVPVTPLRALAAIAVLPSWWLVSEWIRSWHSLGGPWAVYGASQWQHPVVLALAAVGGIWLVSFTLVMANAGLMIAVLPAAAAPVRIIGAAAAAAAVAAGPVAFALAAAEPVAGHVTVALVQPGVVRTDAIRLATEIRLSRQARRADLIIWGESSVDYDLNTHPVAEASLRHLSAVIGRQLLVSQDAINPAGAKSKLAELIGPAGIEGTYVKTRLVPFGEYIPFRSVLGWLTSVSRAAPQNMVIGNGAHVLHAVLPAGRRLTVGVLICFESAFPDMSRVDTGQGAQLIIYQTSDSTFENSWQPEQHASLAALRAAETGRPAVQAALTGDSAAFDARGRLLGWAPTGFSGVVLVRLALPAVSAQTPYDQLGDYVPWVAVGIAVLATIGLARRGRPAVSAMSPPGTASRATETQLG